jgi:predicted dehydrogenase
MNRVRLGIIGFGGMGQVHGGEHVETLQNFVDAILDGTPLIAPGSDGVASVELANAILLSAWRRAPVTLPLDGMAYERELLARAKR